MSLLFVHFCNHQTHHRGQALPCSPPLGPGPLYLTCS